MIEELKKVLNYDPESGELRWLEQIGSNVWAGDIAGTLRKDGYLMIRFRGKGYLSHRVAYALMTGSSSYDSLNSYLDSIKNPESGTVKINLLNIVLENK